jgi:hypothetical protein
MPAARWPSAKPSPSLAARGTVTSPETRKVNARSRKTVIGILGKQRPRMPWLGENILGM